MEDTHKILVRAADILGEYGWTTGNYAVNDAGAFCPTWSPEAVAFCAQGSILRAASDLGIETFPDEGPCREATLELQRAILNRTGLHLTITGWNDNTATGLIDVQEMILSAAAHCKPPALVTA